MMWARYLEKDRMAHLADLAVAVRYAQNANVDEFSKYTSALERLAV